MQLASLCCSPYDNGCAIDDSPCAADHINDRPSAVDNNLNHGTADHIDDFPGTIDDLGGWCSDHHHQGSHGHYHSRLVCSVIH